MGTADPTKRLRVTVVVEVDVEAWSGEYGVDLNRKAVRDDVRSYLSSSINAAAPLEVVNF